MSILRSLLQLQKKKFFSAIHVEEYALAFMVALFFLSLPFLPVEGLFQGDFENTVRHYVLRNANFFWLFFFFLFVVFFLRLFVRGAHTLNEAFVKKATLRSSFFQLFSDFLALSIATLRVVLFIFFAFTLLNIGLVFLVYAVRDRIDNLLLMRLDQLVFHTYPFFWFHEAGSWQKALLDPLAPFIRFSSGQLPTVMGAVGAALIVGNRQDLFRRYLLAIMLVVLFGFPVWLLFPALSPHDAFLVYPSGDMPEDLAASLRSFFPTATVAEFLENITAVKGGVLSVSTVASMHIAWAILCVLFAFRLFRPSIVLLGPWALFLIFGTSYLGQHYAVDALFTIPVIVLGLVLTEVLVRFDEKRRVSSNVRWELPALMHEDLKLFWRDFPLFASFRKKQKKPEAPEG